MPRRLLHPLALVLALAACKRAPEESASPEPADIKMPKVSENVSAWSNDGVVKGVLTRADGTVDPPLGSKLLVSLWGAKFGAEMHVLSKKDIEITGPAPWGFDLKMDESEFDPQGTFTVDARLTAPDGAILFLAKPVRIFLEGVPQGPIEIVMDPMDARATAH